MSIVLLIVAFLFFFFFLVVNGLQTALDFWVSWMAGILGIMTGFALDRKFEQTRDERVKNDFLALMRNELTEIRGKIPPQTKIPLMLYPEVWDSFVSSGLIRLLSSEQVTKLSNVYKTIKGTQYEAEWVRRLVEKAECTPDIEKEKKERVIARYNFLQNSYVGHGKQLTEEIERTLAEKWWN